MSRVLHPFTRRFGAVAVAALLAGSTTPASAQTFGDALIDRPFRDSFSSFILMSAVPSDASTEQRRLTSFSVFGTDGLNVGATLRPLLMRQLPSLEFEVLGVGAERTVATGVNTWSFDATSGSDLISANEAFHFGWWSGGAGGAVLYDEGGSTLNFTLLGSYVVPPDGGSTVQFNGGVQRTYSIQWTAAPLVTDPPPPTVPEPGSAALLTVGLAAMMTRRARRATR